MHAVRAGAGFTAKDGRRCDLRPLARDDLDALVRFANRMVREKKRNRGLGLISFDKRVTRKEEREWLAGVVEGARGKELASVAAFAEGELVGHCDVRRRKASEERHVGVLGVAVLEGYRGVGIGRRLVEEALGEARRIGLRLVEHQVFANNAAAIHLYEEAGFRRAGAVPGKMLREG